MCYSDYRISKFLSYIIEKLTQRFGGLKQGDIIVVKIPELLGDGKTYAVKRIIATEGQKITIRDGKVYVNDSELSEGYINGAGTLAAKGMYDDITVPDNCIYVLGDNRYPGASKDSRTFGPINSDRVEGKVVFRLFPFSEMGYIKLKNLLSNTFSAVGKSPTEEAFFTENNCFIFL